MYDSLSQVRASFGFSQEQLAEKMRKDVSTISRWKRGKTREPLLAPLVNVTNRKYQYVKHMMDPNLQDSVVNSSSITGLFYGSCFMIMAMSKGTLNRYPLLRAAYGFKAASYFRNEGRQLYDDNINDLNKALSLPGSSAICKSPSNSAIVITQALTINFNFVGHGLVHGEAIVMSDDETKNCKKASAEFIFG